MSARTSICLILVAFAAGCRSEPAPTVASSDSTAVRSEKALGPVSLSVEVSPGSVRLSDEPVLTLTIRVEPGAEIKKPPFGESIGEFLIRDFHEPLPRADGDVEIFQQIYTLEPTHAGSLTIAPIAVTFRDTDDGEDRVIESEALNVEVSTIVGDAAPSLAGLKPPAGPIELPSEGPPFRLWGPLLGLLLAVGGVVWYRQRRKSMIVPPPPTPRELAQRELDQIISQRLAETDVKVFYVELTGVVRRYIERSTGVKAPEQTTEEFLREILSKTLFEDAEQRRLQHFLESADLVKFAGHQPVEGDVDASIQKAREFTQLDAAAVSQEADE
jgi:hypothetical protein